jgi:hypothetical protein
MGSWFYQTFGSLPVILCAWEGDSVVIAHPAYGEVGQPCRASALAIARSKAPTLVGAVSTM